MRILVIGSGGREHALIWKLAQSPNVTAIYAAPGLDAAMEHAARVPINPEDIDALVEFAKANDIDLVVPGPEAPLVLGIVDAMASAGIACFGPDSYGAALEGSKSFAKEIMKGANVPTAKSASFEDAAKARAYALKMGAPLVIKADGLAGGKGVIIADQMDDAFAAIDAMLVKGAFGASGARIVIEEKLKGEEASLLCFCDGETARPMASAQDHKAAYDGDLGPNTGGMGAYSPAPVLPDEKLEETADLVIRPILREMARRGHPFKGVLYAGLMMTEEGPKVLEYNVRFGDPECQPLMLRLKNDLADLLTACASGELNQRQLDFTPEAALGVVLVANGYPGSYAKNQPVSGLEAAAKTGVQIFHGGTRQEEGDYYSNGGRVLCVTGLGQTLAEARDKAYDAIKKINMPNSRYRSDIGAKGLNR